MLIIDSRKLLIEKYKVAGQQLKKGNYKGYILIKRILTSLINLTDDEDTIVHQSMIGTIDTAFVKSQSEVKGGARFLSDLGDILIKISEALSEEDSTKINLLLRKFVVVMNERWIESPTLTKGSE